MLFLLVGRASAGVMMQAFYWDVPMGGTWWDTLSQKVGPWAEKGITDIWLPPSQKSQGGARSMGYNPYDYFDQGKYDQLGSIETRFGSESELKSLIHKAHQAGIKVFADIVINHNSGGDLEYNQVAAKNTWTKFEPASGKFPRTAMDFHPNLLHSQDEGKVSGYEQTDVCHEQPRVQDWLWKKSDSYAQWMKNTIGYDGWRFQAVDKYGAWVVKDWLLYAGGNAVGEYWDSNKWTLNSWIDKAGGKVSLFDFPLYYAMDNAFDGNNLMHLVDAGLVSIRPNNAVTFVANHDSDEIFNKHLAYAYILTHQGYPCIFYRDYEETMDKNALNKLISIHEKKAKGSTSILFVDNDEYIAQRNGDPGLIIYINNSAQWKSRLIKSKYKSTRLHDFAEYAKDVVSDSRGEVQLWAPPHGYSVYSRY